MAAIRSSDTTPELMVRKLLYSKGYRYRLYKKNLPGKPDIVLPKFSAVILIHGCYWHGHNCTVGKLPKSKLDYWLPKIKRNIERDKENITSLRALGWRVLVVRECAIRGKSKLPQQDLLQTIQDFLHGSEVALLLAGS